MRCGDLDPERTVWRRNGRRAHTDPGCRHVTEESRPCRAGELGDDLAVCHYCQNGRSAVGGADAPDVEEPDELDGGALRRLYWDEGLSQREIGKLAGVTPHAVSRLMKEHGVETRRDGAPHRVLEEMDPGEAPL